jgi:intracellular septation protein
MQQLLDYIAILAFVIVYFVTRDIFFATAVLMGGVTLQVTAYWLLKKPIGNELKVTFWVSMILGGLTVTLRDETFIQWKPTIVNWLLALTLVGAHLFTKSYLIKRMLGQVMVLPDEAWFALTYGWAAGFAASGALNLWVAYNYSMDTWVTFKLVGLLVINLLFLTCTFAYLYSKDLLGEDNLRNPDDNKSSDTPEPVESGKP